ncbi:MAG: hypothetical protein ACREIA_21340 [Opitutaceae bacterium]
MALIPSRFLGHALLQALLLAAGLASTAEAARAHRDRAQIWFPIDPDSTRIEHPPARSKATYKVETRNCPPGTWRWVADAPAHFDEFDIASALIVRLELSDANEKTLETLAQAAEGVAAAFRVRSGANLEDEPAEVIMRFPDDAHPLTSVLEDWENTFDTRLDEATRILAEVSPEQDAAPLKISAIVARERVTAESAPVELCDAGAWKIHGYRARSTQREAIGPLFFNSSPVTEKDTGADTREAHAAALARQLGEWLRTHYAREAAAAAILADGGDPSRLPAGNRVRTAANR